MNKTRRGDYGNNPTVAQPTQAQSQNSGPSLPNYPGGYNCPTPKAKKYPHPFKAKALKA